MCRLRQSKIDKIQVPDVEVEGDKDDADLLIVGFGGTYGHLHAAMDEMRAAGKKVALAHFRYINPLPKNTAEVMKKYPDVVWCVDAVSSAAGSKIETDKLGIDVPFVGVEVFVIIDSCKHLKRISFYEIEIKVI